MKIKYYNYDGEDPNENPTIIRRKVRYDLTEYKKKDKRYKKGYRIVKFEQGFGNSETLSSSWAKYLNLNKVKK